VGSKNECKAQNLAAKHGVGFRPLAAGRLTDTEGGVVKDKFGTELGVAVIEFDPDFLRLSDVIGLIALQMGETETYIHRPVIGPLSGREVTQEECIRYTISAFERVGALRRTFHSTLGLCRHAGHPGNFLFNPRTDQLFVTDLDSCVPIESLLPEARGPQILRDLTSDLFRCVQNLLYRFFTDEFIVGMSQGKYDPFTGYLRNYFGQQVDDSTIRNTGVSLLIGTLSFLDEYGDALRGVYPDISGPVTRAILNGTPMPGSPGWSSWYFNLIPLYMVFIEHLYLLLRQTELFNGEACLPAVSVGELRNGVAQGLAEFILEILKEDAQLRARHGADAVT